MDPGRIPNNLKGLLRFCMEAGKDYPTDAKPMDPEKAAWLREALAGMTVDLVDNLKAEIKIVLDNLMTPTAESFDTIHHALVNLHDLMYETGLPDVFCKIGGLDMIITLLDHKPTHPQSGLLIASVVQNNPAEQKLAIDKGILTLCLKRLSEVEDDPDTLRCLFSAVSALTRGSEATHKQFIADNGFTIVFDLFDRTTRTSETQTEYHRFNCATAFFVSCMCREMLDEQLAALKSFNLSERIAEITLRLNPPSEDLVDALVNLLSGRVSILLDPPPKLTAASVRLPVSENTRRQLVEWLSSEEVSNGAHIEHELQTKLKKALIK